ncbi:ryanodine receptor protein [Danaus plexippus plexippus]|uniref:Ryanodine receptor protein n=2 Tax=Danaus TaxID=13036 RepID=A0A212EUW1_DANPL|nr:uncharacterized protein LOC116770935 [Danaus plexippus plexippus]OWR45276.1 ryanodine receptor protein [Danaus plexippus plexippus]
MVSVQTIATIVVKVFKIVLNIVILVLYRTGYNGEFLGVGGTWNLNEEKNPDAEIVASGVIVGYLIYTLVQVVTFLFGTTEHKRAMSEIVMNFIGVFLWIAVGAVALHYWGGYQGEHQFQFVFAEKQVGLAVGALCVIQGAVYLLDTALSVIHFTKEMLKLECLYSGSLVTISPRSKNFLQQFDIIAVKIAPLTDNVSEYGGGARVVWAMSAGDREAEAQAKKEEGSTSEDGRTAVLKQHWCIGLRIVELLFAVIAIGLMVGALNSHQLANIDHRHIALIYSTYSGFIIIVGVLIIARLLGESAGWRTSLGFSIIGAILFTATAAVIFYDWHRSYYANVRPNKQFYDLVISSGVFSIINAVVFIVHAFLTFKKEADY